jgi:hypothetical protein
MVFRLCIAGFVIQFIPAEKSLIFIRTYGCAKGGLNTYANAQSAYRQGVDVLIKKESVRKRTV